MLSLAVFGVTDAPLSQLSDAFETLLVDSFVRRVARPAMSDILRCDSHVRFTPESGHSVLLTNVR